MVWRAWRSIELKDIPLLNLTKFLVTSISLYAKRMVNQTRALKAARKHLKSEGKGNKPYAADPLEPAYIGQMWSCGALGDTNLTTLQQILWWLIATQMGTRVRDEHHKVCFGDFVVKCTIDGREYVQFHADRGNKTKTGETKKAPSTYPLDRQLKPWNSPPRNGHELFMTRTLTRVQTYHRLKIFNTYVPLYAHLHYSCLIQSVYRMCVPYNMFTYLAASILSHHSQNMKAQLYMHVRGMYVTNTTDMDF